MSRMSLRARLTLAFAAGMTLVSLAVASFVYSQVRSDLRSEVDMGLRARAQALITEPNMVRGIPQSSGHLADNDEAFAQVLAGDGRILAATRSVAREPLLRRTELRHDRPWLTDHRPTGLEAARLLAVPTSWRGARVYLVVGATLSDTREALTRLLVLFAIALPVALLASSLIGWLLAGAALRPVRRMSAEAAAITDADPARRLAVPTGDRGLAVLATTVNATFDRLQTAIRRERTFAANASHELRTPLTILKAEVDTALSAPRSPHELREALDSAASEIRHLIAIAEGLLVIARTVEGRMPVERVPTSLAGLVGERAEAFSGMARERDVELVVRAGDQIVELDPTRVRQAIDNLLDNAVRHCATGGRVTINATVTAGTVSITVQDSGLGFSDAALAAAFQPFNRTDDRSSGAGLGLALARAIAEAHGGGAEARNVPAGGAAVTLTFPAGTVPQPGEPLPRGPVASVRS
ncbi:MAG TPA: ATP-binding protein [Gaiellales bacterium]|nr:ATP-binding protein [Gaiellales bacterium]